MEEITEKKTLAIIFGQLIRYERKSRNWSQADLGEKAQIIPSTISRLERGEVLPDLYSLHHLENAFDFQRGHLSVSVETVMHQARLQTERTMVGASLNLGWWSLVGRFAGTAAITAIVYATVQSLRK